MSLWTTHTQRRYRKNRRPFEDGGRDWTDAAKSQGRLGANRSCKRPGRILLQPMEGIQLILWFCTSGLQNYELINSLVISHKIWGNLLWQPKETSTPSSLPPISIYLCVCGQLLSHVWLFATPWIIAHQAPLSMGFPRQEYWSWLPFPSLADLPDPGIKPASPALQVVSLPTEPPGKSPSICLVMSQCFIMNELLLWLNSFIRCCLKVQHFLSN